VPTSVRVTSTPGVALVSPRLGLRVGELMLDSGRRHRRARDPNSPDLRPCGAGGAQAWEALPANPRPQALCGRPRPRMRHRHAHDSPRSGSRPRGQRQRARGIGLPPCGELDLGVTLVSPWPLEAPCANRRHDRWKSQEEKCRRRGRKLTGGSGFRRA
jgi:hypothetical protein